MWKRQKRQLTPEQAAKRETKMADRSNMAQNIGKVRQESHNIGSYLFVRIKRTWYYGGAVLALNTGAVVYLLGHSLGAW